MTTLTLPWTSPPMTKNKVRRMHYRTEAKERAAAIDEAREVISAAKVAPLEAAVIVMHWRMATRRRMDGDGADPTKALVIDALVLEGVLPDDSWQVVVHSGVTCHPPVKGLPGAMWLSIYDPMEVSDDQG